MNTYNIWIYLFVGRKFVANRRRDHLRGEKRYLFVFIQIVDIDHGHSLGKSNIFCVSIFPLFSWVVKRYQIKFIVFNFTNELGFLTSYDDINNQIFLVYSKFSKIVSIETGPKTRKICKLSTSYGPQTQKDKINSYLWSSIH